MMKGLTSNAVWHRQKINVPLIFQLKLLDYLGVEQPNMHKTPKIVSP